VLQLSGPEIGDVLSRLPWALALNAALAAAARLAGTVRVGGAVLGATLGTCVLAFGGWGAFILLAVFFALGSAVTRWGWRSKERAGVAEGHGGARGAAQVLANGAPAAVLAVLAWAGDGAPLYMIGLAGSLAAASADTASSEIGQVYGSRPVSIPAFKPVPVGTAGAVSGAGTAAGAGAGLVMGLAALAAGVVDLYAVPIVALSAVVGTTVESLAAPSVKAACGHHALNLINSCAGAACAMALWALIF
jgi:uncharacterized protein (TIGR00297 family)